MYLTNQCSLLMAESWPEPWGRLSMSHCSPKTPHMQRMKGARLASPHAATTASENQVKYIQDQGTHSRQRSNGTVGMVFASHGADWARSPTSHGVPCKPGVALSTGRCDPNRKIKCLIVKAFPFSFSFSSLPVPLPQPKRWRRGLQQHWRTISHTTWHHRVSRELPAVAPKPMQYTEGPS